MTEDKIDYLQEAKDMMFPPVGVLDSPVATASAFIDIAETLRAILAEMRAQKQPAQTGRCPECRWYNTSDRGCDHKLVQWEPTLFAGDMPDFGCVYWEQRA